MNHKRGRPKNRRAGCLLCKPHKMNGYNPDSLNATGGKPGNARGARIAVISKDEINSQLDGKNTEEYGSKEDMRYFCETY